VTSTQQTHLSATEARNALIALRAEVGKAVVGNDAAITGLILALLCRGHVLIEGVPGVAKTLLVRALATALDLQTKRTPPKTQSSLLEAMEERQVSLDGRSRPLPDPFIVIATQNPVEYEGTYPLPEAQLDRFLLKLTMPAPSREDEVGILVRHSQGFDPRNLVAAGIRPVAGAAHLAAARAAVATVAVRPEVIGYIVDVCRATRALPSIRLGVSPRGATALLAATRAWAWLAGRDYATPDDVKSLARPALRHRLDLRPEAELEGATADGVLDRVLASVPVPR
jgi:MoxR-like ATPase